MKNIFLKLESKLRIAFISLALVYFSISLYYFVFLSAAGSGDEGLFVNDLLFLQKEGWLLAIAKSISIPYMLLVYPFSFLFTAYLALRFANVFLLVVLLFYFYKIAKIRSGIFYGYLLFYLGTVHYFFVGTNDVLFFVGLVVFMTEVYYFIEAKKMNNSALAFSALVISFFTRELFWVYFPVVLLSCFFLYKRDFSFFTKKMMVPLLLFFVFMVFNIPSLLSKSKLSYDQKVPSSSVQSSWNQRQYLAQLMVNKGEIPNFTHPSWEQTDLYLKKNGINCLPNGIIDGMTFDYVLTIKEFFKDFYYSVFFGFRQLGFMLLFPFYFIVRNSKSKNILDGSLFIPFVILMILGIFSLIIISFIEPRWYMSIFILAIVFYHQNQSRNKIYPLIIIANYVILMFFSIWGIYGLLHKFMGVL